MFSRHEGHQLPNYTITPNAGIAPADPKGHGLAIRCNTAMRIGHKSLVRIALTIMRLQLIVLLLDYRLKLSRHPELHGNSRGFFNYLLNPELSLLP